MKALLAASVLIALAGPALAQRVSNVSGAKLGELCSSRDRNPQESCRAYLEGISDTVSFYQHLMPKDGSKGGKLPDYVCVPGPTTGPQLQESYVRWLKAHQDAQRQPAAQAAIRALNDTYLCSGEQAKP